MDETVARLFKRMYLFLEDGEWERADEYCERILDLDPENAEAYLGKLLVEVHEKGPEDLRLCGVPLLESEYPYYYSPNYKKAVRFGRGKLAIIDYLESMRFYHQAIDAMNKAKTEGEFREAARLFEMSDWCEADELRKKCLEMAELELEKEKKREALREAEEEAIREARKKAEHALENMGSVNVGDSIFLGEYFQSKYTDMCQPIEWIVLAKEDDKVLVISKYALDYREYHQGQFNTVVAGATWSNCDLHEWLTKAFFYGSGLFQENRIINSLVYTDDITSSKSSAIVDKVFLLSIDEAAKYFSSDDARKCCKTARFADYEQSDYCDWWLRSSDCSKKSAALVNSNGQIASSNMFAYIGVRPAMWLYCKADSESEESKEPDGKSAAPDVTLVEAKCFLPLDEERSKFCDTQDKQRAKQAEADERASHEADERAKREADERAKREADERAKREADERAKRDAEERARFWANCAKSEVGDSIRLGRYVQKRGGAPEPIEWLVLKKEDGKALLFSKNALDCLQYDSSDTAGEREAISLRKLLNRTFLGAKFGSKAHNSIVTWEACSLRRWLNNTFIHAAFSPEEQIRILCSTASADYNPYFDTAPGKHVVDKIFLLSILEVNGLLGSDSARQCQGTEYCYAQGAGKTGNGNCCWWLRSPGRKSDRAACVDYVGSVLYDGENVDRKGYAVRPALWIKLESLSSDQK